MDETKITAMPVNAQTLTELTRTLQKYKAGKANLEKRIIDNQQWYKLRQWECLRRRGGAREQIEPVSAWLFNAIANKHAEHTPARAGRQRAGGDAVGRGAGGAGRVRL